MKNFILIVIALLFSHQLTYSQYLEDKGRWLVKPTYEKMRNVDEKAELFPVADYFRKWGYINISGSIVIPFKYDNAYSFSEELAAVKINGKYGYLNTQGIMQIQANYETVGKFMNGKAIVSSNGKNFLINTKGEIVSQKYSDMGWFSKEYVACKVGSLYNIIDLSGKTIKSKFCSDYFYQSEGISGVKIYGKWGFVDENLNQIIKPQFTEKLVYAFHDSLARFKKNGKVGVIDRTGKEILPAKYENLYEFSNGLAAYMENGKWGYINKSGEIIIHAQYYDVRNFNFGMAKVKSAYTNTSLIDKNNKIILDGMKDVKIITDKLLAIKTIDGWGLFMLN